MRHVDLDLLILAVEGQLPPGTLLRVILAHLRDLCPECRAALELLQGRASERGVEEAWHGCEPDHPPVHALRERHVEGGEGTLCLVRDPRYARAIAAAEQGLEAWTRRVEEDHRLARRDLAELHRLPAAERAGRVVRSRTRFRTRALVELILAEARSMARENPHEALSFAELVPVVLDLLPRLRDSGWAEVARLRALAWRANALRLLSRPYEASRAFAALRAELAASAIDDSGLHAELSMLEGTLAIEHGQYGPARRLIDQAALLYRTERDGAGLARVLMLRGIVERREGDAEAAVCTQREVIALLSAAAGDADSYDLLAAVGNVALCLCDSERYEEAAAAIAAHEALFRQQRWSPRWRAKEALLRGRVAGGLGRMDEAEAFFREARDGALALEDYLGAAIASLDLAALYVAQRRLAEVREIAGHLVPTLEAYDLRQEAMAALLLFTRAAINEELTVEMVLRLRWSLEVGGHAAEQPASIS